MEYISEAQDKFKDDIQNFEILVHLRNDSIVSPRVTSPRSPREENKNVILSQQDTLSRCELSKIVYF